MAKNTAAMAHENTMRLKLKLNIHLGPLGSATEHEVINESVHPFRLKDVGHTVLKVPGKAAKKQTLTLIAVGKTVALRQEKKAWQCTTLKKVTGASLGGTSIGPTSGLNSILSAGDLSHLTLVGTSTIRNIPVWEVDGKLTIPADASTGTPAFPLKFKMYISQADYTFVRLVASTSIKEQGVSIAEKVTEDASHYGEKVAVKLPSACAKK